MSFENVEDVYVLSPMQQGILFHSLYTPHSQAYIIQSAWALNGALAVPLFRQAWGDVVDRHSVLRTKFVWEGLAKPLQVVHRHVELCWRQDTWCALPPAEQDAVWEQLLAADRAQRFDLDRAPLMRFALCQLAEDSYRFIWSYHHLLLDGWSYPHVLKQVFATYGALCRGERPLPEQQRPYRDYIAWLEQQDVSQAEAFWRQTLKGFSAPTRLTVERIAEKRSSQQQECFAEQERSISRESTAALQAFARGHQLTLHTLVQGAWALLLSHYSAELDLVYGTVVSGRPVSLAGVDTMIGLFVNTLPVRVRISPEVALLPWLQELQRQHVVLREYENSPLVQIQGYSQVPRGIPLFETILAFENYPVIAFEQEQTLDLRVSPLSAFTRTSYPLELIVVPRATLALRMSYDCARFEPGTIGRMLGHMQILLEGMLTHASRPLAALPILSAAQRRLILYTWNMSKPQDAASGLPAGVCVHHLIESQVERTPGACAVVYAGETLTYSALNQRANQLAHALRQAGVGPEARVGVYLERSVALIVSLLAILKAGGAYVPLDPAYPAGRLASMLVDARVQLVLTQQALLAHLPRTHPPTLCLDTPGDQLSHLPISRVAGQVHAENLAYVMYTSGSTGTPKGIAITHRSIVNLVYRPSYVQVRETDAFLLLSSIAFDTSTFEIWGCLANGARLVVAPAEQPSLHELSQILVRQQVSVLWLTAGLFHQMVELHLEGLRTVKQVLAGGEALSLPHMRQALEGLPGCQLINGYGPTENTTFSCCHALNAGEVLESCVPIGRPIASTQAYVLDKQLNPLPIGVLGELYLGGAGLARGYLNRPELTAGHFVPDPFSQRPGARLYRTGDMVRTREDGTLLFVGRRDRQIKLRGYRVELGEIESLLVQHPTVRSAVVVVHEKRPADRQIVAYLVAHRPGGEEPAPADGELRHYLRAWLPEYMIPAVYIWLDALPLTANGKIDRQALPAPENRGGDALAYRAPRTPGEQKLADLWAALFQLERVGVTDNFFALGGHSILAIRLCGQIQALFQIQVSLRTIFEHPTVAGLALVVVEKQLEQRKSSEIARLLEAVENLSETADPEEVSRSRQL
ncbi:MAG TPA: amino acid adenylation domain-containing protein [Ktedonobacteraceae bacterium]